MISVNSMSTSVNVNKTVKAGGSSRRLGGRPAAAKVGGRRVAKRVARPARVQFSPTAVTAAEYAFGSPLASLDPAAMGFDMEAAEEVAKANFAQVSRSRRFQPASTKVAQRRPDRNSAMRRQGRVMQPGGASSAQRR
jgi:hypothetical protein